MKQVATDTLEGTIRRRTAVGSEYGVAARQVLE
jgi:hypothetical protein